MRFLEKKGYNKHHKAQDPGPLEKEEIGTDMIRDFPIDPLHCFDLGVMKKLVLCWTGNLRLGRFYNAPSTIKVTLSSTQILSVDTHFAKISKHQPSEYNRPSRELSMCKFWKGSEYSCVLHCTGPVVFKGVLPEIVYKNFLLLHVATTIVTCKEHKSLWPLSKSLFLEFVNTFKLIYGSYAVSYNVHNLLHVFEDLDYFKVPVNENSTTSFESRLGVLKKLVRGGNKRIEQVIHRAQETIQFEILNFKNELEEGKVFAFVTIFFN